MINTFGGGCLRVGGGRSGRFLLSDLTKSGLTSGFPELRTNQTVWSWFGVGRIAPAFFMGSMCRDGSVAARVPDSWSKCGGFESRQEWWENFLLWGQLSELNLISVSAPPPCTAVVCKRCLSLCQKYNWQLQLNTHAVYVCFCTRFSSSISRLPKHVFFWLSMSLICLDSHGFLIKYVFNKFRNPWPIIIIVHRYCLLRNGTLDTEVNVITNDVRKLVCTYCWFCEHSLVLSILTSL